MRLRLLLLLFTLISINVSATTHYASPTGVNAFIASTPTNPMSLVYGNDSLQPGDTLLLEGIFTLTENLFVIQNDIYIGSYGTGATLQGNQDNSTDGFPLITLRYPTNVTIENLTFANHYGNYARGILAWGAGENINILNNEFIEIGWNTDPDAPATPNNGANAILILGNVNTGSLTDVNIIGNSVENCILGYSEAITLSGNVDGFVVAENEIAEITNIGIDIAGHFDYVADYDAPFDPVLPALNQARNGLVKNNFISEAISPYATSAGLYCDGCRDVVFDGNLVQESGAGISIGCEVGGDKTASNVTVINNIFSLNQESGMFIGSLTSQGTANGPSSVDSCIIRNNTFFKNCQLDGIPNGNDYEIFVQNSNDNVFKNNIIYMLDTAKGIVAAGSSVVNNFEMDYNLFYRENLSEDDLVISSAASTLTGNVNSQYGDPEFDDAANDEFAMSLTSRAANAGDPNTVIIEDEEDFEGNERIQETIADIGALESESDQTPPEPNTVFANTTCIIPAMPAIVDCWDIFVVDSTTCVWSNIGIQPLEPSKVNCWDVIEFNSTTCEWENVGLQPVRPGSDNCWDDFIFNANLCAWDNLGMQPIEPPVVNCWDQFAFVTDICIWRNTGTEPVKPPARNCWDNFVIDPTLCAYINTGTQPEQPIAGNCWDDYQFDDISCTWINNGFQPTAPVAANCWDNFVFDAVTTCSWINFGTEPLAPAQVNCWDIYVLDTTICQYVNTGAQPIQPATVNCWDNFVFDAVTTCSWINVGTEPLAPAQVNCWDNYVLDTSICQYVNTGAQPVQPTAVNCWDDFVFDGAITCSWINDGTEPLAPTPVNCWDDYVLDSTSCQYVNTGTEPVAPIAANCWDDFVLDTNSCQYINAGTQPAEPLALNCWDVFQFNTTTCLWVNTGIEPVAPGNLECNEIAIFNAVSCAYDVVVDGTQILGCTDPTSSNYNPNATCNDGSCCTGVEPTPINCWDVFALDTITCSYSNIGIMPVEPVAINCWDNYQLDNVLCSYVNLGVEPVAPAVVNCWDNYQFDNTNCQWNNTGTQAAEPIVVNCWDNYQFDSTSCAWANVGSQEVIPVTACNETASFNEVTCTWDVTIDLTIISGCTDSLSANYNPNAICDDGSCNTVTDCVVFNTENFENGWGIWKDGGRDCALVYEYTQDKQRNYYVRTRDNSGSSSSLYTAPQDFSCASQVIVDFSYFPSSMENGEDFFLEYSTDGGNTFTVARQYVSGVDFTNNNDYTESVDINDTFTDNTVLRLRCDASSNGDKIYVDDITITLCGCSTITAPTCNGTIAGFQLIDQDGNILTDLAGGEVFCPTDFPSPWTRASVVASDDHESMAIYVTTPYGSVFNLANKGNYDSEVFSIVEDGMYTVTASLYSENNLGGLLCEEQSISFTVAANTCSTGGGNNGNPGDCFSLFDYEGFESGLGIWNDGGSDCYRNYEDGIGGNGSNWCMRLRDNCRSKSSLYSDKLQFGAVTDINIQFMYTAESMESKEDFFLEYSTDNGRSWTIEQAWVSGVDFINGEFYTESVILNGSFSDETRFRFRCDASSNYDKIFIDEVFIYTCGTVPAPLPFVTTTPNESNDLDLSATQDTDSNSASDNAELSKEVELILYPNPVSEVLNIKGLNNSTYELFDITGNRVMSRNTGTQVKLENLPNGTYLLKTNDGRVKRFIKI